MSLLLYELPPVRRFRLPFTRRRAFFELGGGVYEVLGSLGFRETGEELTLARYERGQGPEALCVIERLHCPRDHYLRREILWEAEHAMRLRHPGLLRLRQLAVHGDRPYAVLEYVGGRSLASVLRLSAVLGRKPLSVEASCEVAAQVADALDHLHTRTDVRGWRWALHHGDLSPSLIWLAPEGRVKLVGFGTRVSRLVARWYKRREWEDGCRDALYRPPVEGGSPREAPACLLDLYALGVVLLEMLQGQPLWDPEARWAWRAMGVPPEEVERRLRGLRLPSGLDDVLRDALRCAPSGRVSTAAKLRDALRGYTRDRHQVATELGWLELELPGRVLPWKADPLSGP